MELREHEVVEDLQYNGLKIIRDTRGFTYGTDSVLLANFVHAKECDHVLDLGAGSGILSILINGKTKAHVTAMEINEKLCDMLRRSVQMNGQEEGIRVLCADLREKNTDLNAGSFDAAVCNPPYFASGTKSEVDQRRVSTHQDTCTVYDVSACAKRLLKNGGRLYLVYPASLLAEAVHAIKENRIEPKRIQLVFTRRNNPPHIVLIEAKKGGRTGLIWEEPIFL
jgi:tRNA1Val (adenine37-N6)-methyltransferase